MRIRLVVTVALAAGLSLIGSAQAATIVIGNGLAADCSQEAIKGRSDKAVLETCTAALEGELMPRTDTAKTYVNRGVVYLRRGVYDLAERDLDKAQTLAADLPEVFINRGAVRIRQHRFEEAVSEIDKGLAMNPTEPEKGYFNRAVAKEAMEDLQGAYLDFRKASELKPGWDEPKKQMARFVVETRTSSVGN